MRTQTGNVILRSKVWYVRFYNRDGKRVIRRLCEKARPRTPERAPR